MSQTYAEQPDSSERQSDTWMQRVNIAASWDEQDLANGQPVIVAVRWIMIITALFLAVWNVSSMEDLRLQIIAILLLAVTNFYLQAQLLMKRPLQKYIVYGASAVDILLITLLVMFQGGYFSSIYVFYLPAIAAFAVAFPRGLTALYTGIVIVLYGMIATVTDGAQTDVIISRLLMIAAVAFCGSIYLQLEHQRRREAVEREELFATGIEDLVDENLEPA
jgi:hypothetical protein